MRYLFCILAAALAFSCSSGKKEKEADPATTNAEMPMHGDTDAVRLPDTANAPKPDMEHFGPVFLGQSDKDAVVALGAPDTKSKAEEWGADGMMHEDWTYKTAGLVVNMSFNKTGEPNKSVFSISAKAPCNFKTVAGAGIGSSYEDVKKLYAGQTDGDATNTAEIVVGSVYGGIIFQFTGGKASSVFLGEAAE